MACCLNPDLKTLLQINDLVSSSTLKDLVFGSCQEVNLRIAESQFLMDVATVPEPS